MSAAESTADAAPELNGGSPPPTRGAALDQATFFRACEGGNLTVVTGLLRDSKVDVNAVNNDGVTALVLSVYQYEQRRNTDLVTVLLQYNADVTQMLPSTVDRKICIVKQQQHHKASSSGAFVSTSSGGTAGTCAVGLGSQGSSLVSEHHSTRKIGLGGKTALLIALELKSALYLKGWDYRHWDNMLNVLAFATAKNLEGKLEATPHPPPHSESVRAGVPPLARADSVSAPLLSAAGGDSVRFAAVAAGWAAVFESGKHETVEVWAEGKHMEVLTQILITNSKVLRKQVEAASMQGMKGRVDLKDVSFTVIKEVLAFLYSGHVDTNFVRMRGVDLLLAAHKYRIWPLKDACVGALDANAENWNKLVAVALEVNAPSLVLKCAKSICETLEGRSVWRGQSQKHVFASTITPPPLPLEGLTMSPQEV